MLQIDLALVAKMKIGISSYTYRWALGGGHPFLHSEFKLERPLTAFDLVDKVSNLGLEVLQICENLDFDMPAEDYERLGEAAEEKGIILELGTDGLNHTTLERYARIADLTGSHLLRVYLKKREPTKKVIERIWRSLPLLKNHELKLAIENSSLCLYTSRELAEIMRRTDDPMVGACIDVANSLGLLEKPLKTVETLAPYALSLHLKDFRIERKRIGGFTIYGVPLGKGMLDVKAVLDIIREPNRNPNILLEQWMERKENVEETLREEERWLTESLGFLRSVMQLQQ